MSPAVFPASKITWHLPLNNLLWQTVSLHLSLSWLLGSPLPIPIIFAGPLTENVMRLSASGTSLPSLSITLMLMTDASCSFAVIVVLEGLTTTSTGAPVVSILEDILLPPLNATASKVPG